MSVRRLHERYGQEGIVIPFPIGTIVQRNSSESPATPPASP